MQRYKIWNFINIALKCTTNIGCLNKLNHAKCSSVLYVSMLVEVILYNSNIRLRYTYDFIGEKIKYFETRVKRG